jgi:hypothetical protein
MAFFANTCVYHGDLRRSKGQKANDLTIGQVGLILWAHAITSMLSECRNLSSTILPILHAPDESFSKRLWRASRC